MKHQSSPHDSNGSFCCSDEHIQHFNWGAMYFESLYDIPNLIRLVIQGMATPLPTVHHHLPIGSIGSETMVNQRNQHKDIIISLKIVDYIYPVAQHLSSTNSEKLEDPVTFRLASPRKSLPTPRNDMRPEAPRSAGPSSPVGSWLSQ